MGDTLADDVIPNLDAASQPGPENKLLNTVCQKLKTADRNLLD